MARVSAEERRVLFIEAAARVIASDGHAAATTRRIAAEADAPLAALHYCFKSKEELLREVHLFLSRDYVTRLPPLEDGGQGVKAALRAHGRRVWQRILSMPHEQVTTFELLLRRVRLDAEESREALNMNRAMYDGWILNTVAALEGAARAAGEPVPTNLTTVARFFVAGIDGISIQHLADPDPERSARLVDMLAVALASELEYAVPGPSDG